ncbi:MAG: class II aldolase/adducin family protein [Chloroflexi bacterium]|nr:class II aldolase/adducin family protein [Chloroflexota bacterium]
MTSNDPRPLMIEIGRLMYDRFLTNSAGGNISCRVDNRIYITPRGSASKHRWQLREDMIIVLDNDLNPIEGDAAQVSREAQLHFACYREFPEINGVIHAHARYLSVFAAAGKPVLPTNEYTEKFGVVEVVPPLPSHSTEVAEAFVDKLRPRRETLQHNGLGLILARHGVAVVGRDLADAYDTLERLEWSACTMLLQDLLVG